MSTIIRGTVYVLGDNVDTDQILSAKYLKVNPATAAGRAQLGALAMCGLPPGAAPFLQDAGQARHAILVAGRNMGCGSSREHAVVALGAAGVKAVLAESFARIFFRNCVATGELLPLTCTHRLADWLCTGDEVVIDVARQLVTRVRQQAVLPLEPAGELANIIDAGGLFAFARASGRIA
ncbi:3-isopropylmalate dehydratase [Pantoea sp. 1.19]|uniref:LeuD/DmdB family oxidoreductase small subunit n=1 Tax=Pantoea sp. 1.19 TaxID=1925589 RepID=UPI000948DEAE|nr:3-isopropylmalate dehydratase [Pantoea sp. 1.19]